MGGNLEIEVAQDLRAEPVAQSDIFEPNQIQLRSTRGASSDMLVAPGPPASLRPANPTKWLCFVYGFRFVNGHLVASRCPAFEFCPRSRSGAKFRNEGAPATRRFRRRFS